MDTIDHAIIDQLRANGRLSNQELAERVGLSPSPCLRRVRRLESNGMIVGYHARISAGALGRSFQVQVDINLTDQAKVTIEAFEAALVAFDEVIEARRMFGTPDYQVLVATEDLSAYERFMTEDLLALPGMGQLQSRFAMKTLKSDALEPPRSHPQKRTG